jgi:hypothetical protein
MGNIKSTIDLDMKQLDELIIKGQFDEAKKKFIKSENSLKSTSSEEKKSEITNYLIFQKGFIINFFYFKKYF